MRVFEASISGGIVSANGGVVLNCPIMGEGGDSSGYLVISESDLFYLPKTTPDVKSLISLLETFSEKLELLCDKIAAITVTCSIPGSPSSIPINSAAFAATKAELITIHSDLTELKGALK